jgi:hypothetical protein
MTQPDALTTDLAAVRRAALKLAERYAGTHAQDLRHIALDAQYAIEGCPNSLESVTEFLADNHDLWMASEIEARPAHYTLGALV